MNNLRVLQLFLLVLTLLYLGEINVMAADIGHKNGLYDLAVENVNGEKVSLEKFKGKVSLVVNTASECGFTSQYAGLQKLYEEYRDRGFEILAFPSNDFGSQEPGDNSEIKKLCELKYKTTFPIFSKGIVKGENRQPVYSFLTTESEEKFRGDPGWNFVKLLVNKNGQVVARFSSMTSPTSSKIRKAIEEAL